MLLVVALGYGVVNGLASGGDGQIALWHVRPFLDLLVLFLLFQTAYRGSADLVSVGRTIVLAASAKAVLAIWVRYRVAPHFPLKPMEYTTNHGDSMLFVAACAILLAQVVERARRRAVADLVIFFPLIVWGMVANARRLAWVELAFVALLFLWVTDHPRLKRTLRQGAILATPLLVLYAAAGWNSQHPVFAPVATLKSVSDSKVDRSTWDRHVESWNIATSVREAPLRGRGFGMEYTEYIPMDDISAAFPMYRSEPHNMLLGLLLFAGAIGLAGLVAPYALTVFLSARAYRSSTISLERAACLVCMAVVLVIWLQVHGDMGVFSPQASILGALAMAFSGKLASFVGAYPVR